MGSGLLRDRGCLYYVPWIALMGLALMGGAIGVWINYTTIVYNSTKEGLNYLS
eukprot:CAMPEP_0119114156 /NCGR_PEP_ID=MMETSP1180-20130426/46399_1 /TAXON_ID=3052 ORGANISM="Chlamydomonas cf sp, Strain CCMP681" /NCGR_SAMPLE_ID=MMETSP1180 /ASSEMBLY_ACC=CAM_ASM_000741 /LENGTH=52 /DNA_ID=CAMNT_0007102561 /DNA_START=17 /DNA_END=171 /DNA_ORIENTATION=-